MVLYKQQYKQQSHHQEYRIRKQKSLSILSKLRPKN